MKKFICLLMCVVLAISLFACGEKSDSSDYDVTRQYGYGIGDDSPGNNGDNSPDVVLENPVPPEEGEDEEDEEVPKFDDAGDDNVSPGAPAPDGGGNMKNSPPTNTDTDDEEYLEITENEEVNVSDNSVITFSLKIDSASYRNVARYIEDGRLPPKDAVRIEEMINYFKYDEILLNNNTPFSIYTELGQSPFNTDNYLAFVRVKSKDIDKSQLPDSNLTFLIDTSGSMDSYDKLPLLKSAFTLLVETLTENDVVSIVTYAGNAGVLLDSVRGDQKDKIISAIDNLSAYGSTAGADGINTAYKLAEQNFMKNGNNRVILATDGDFNVGISSVKALENLMTEKRDSGIYLTILGFGTENLKDNKMETMAKNGSGNYHYIDCAATAQKVLVDELSANLFTVADDVKAQVEFNPALVSSYRLIGYENSMLKNRDFENDKKDAGEIGIGTDVILMFELELTEDANYNPVLKYQPDKDSNDFSDELFEVRIRYKNPGENESLLITHPVKSDRIFDFNSTDFIFATSVAGFGQLLRSSDYIGNFTVEKALAMAMDSMGKDRGGYRSEFVGLLKKYQKIY